MHWENQYMWWIESIIMICKNVLINFKFIEKICHSAVEVFEAFYRHIYCEYTKEIYIYSRSLHVLATELMFLLSGVVLIILQLLIITWGLSFRILHFNVSKITKQTRIIILQRQTSLKCWFTSVEMFFFFSSFDFVNLRISIYDPDTFTRNRL